LLLVQESNSFPSELPQPIKHLIKMQLELGRFF